MMNANVKKVIIGVGIFFILIVLCLVLIIITRNVSVRHIDDVSPEIFCEPEYIGKSDLLLVIPNFENNSIAENKEWCKYILSLNKTLGMHGVYHNYNEFCLSDIDENYIQYGIEEFEKCFGYKPVIFRAPQLCLSKENRKILEEMNFTIMDYSDNIVHKVYHCSDGGRIRGSWFYSNNFMDWI